MRIALVNVPHPAIGSRIPDGHLRPLGLLAVGGPQVDEGHAVSLVDGEFGPMPLADLVSAICWTAPEAVLFGQSGSSSGRPVISGLARVVRAPSSSSRASARTCAPIAGNAGSGPGGATVIPFSSPA